MKFFGRQKGRNTSRYTFEAPGILRQRSVDVKEGGPSFGAALHCIPLGKGRSRLLFKAGVFLPAGPRWRCVPPLSAFLGTSVGSFVHIVSHIVWRDPAHNSFSLSFAVRFDSILSSFAIPKLLHSFDGVPMVPTVPCQVFITNLPALPKLIISLKPTVLRHLNSCKVIYNTVEYRDNVPWVRGTFEGALGQCSHGISLILLQ